MSARIDATITSVEGYHAFAIDDWGTRYFIFHSAVERMGRYSFADLVRGSRVRLTPIQHPKGPRGIEVQVLSISPPADTTVR